VTEVEEFEKVRPLLFGIAYRMTGSVAEAEDLVQESFFRFERAIQSGSVIESPKAYLAATTTRLAIDDLHSARARRESYVGTWLPEPIVADLHESPEQMAELSDSLSMAFLLLLENLSPVERAVFLLREVFDYSYEDIAHIVEKSEANCRQIFGRARQHMSTHQGRFEASREQSEALLRSFLAAARDGDMDQLVGMLAADATFSGDGGGKANAARETLYGPTAIANIVITLFKQAPRLGATVELARVNGGPGLAVFDPEHRIASVLSIEVADGLIQSVRGVVNPDKLKHLGLVSDMARIRHKASGPPPSVP
jgi:RNA polymerase sigma-70 factor, ECF subfamily